MLSREVHSRRIDAATGRLLVERVLRLAIRTVHRAELYLRAYDIARSLGWAKAYDALYLAVADLEAAELLTIDGGMHKAAVRLSIRTIFIGG